MLNAAEGDLCVLIMEGKMGLEDGADKACLECNRMCDTN